MKKYMVPLLSLLLVGGMASAQATKSAAKTMPRPASNISTVKATTPVSTKNATPAAANTTKSAATRKKHRVHKSVKQVQAKQ